MIMADEQLEGCVSFRRTRDGPEQELVDWFLDQGGVQPRHGERITLFREPRLPSGFPDLVAVVWKESVASKWNYARRDLAAIDLRVMHHLTISGPTTLPQLRLLFRAQGEKSVDLLHASRMVRYRNGQWSALPLSGVFAAKRIVAIEAKVNKWRAALDQAFLNTWFTPESYILIPSLPRRTSLLELALQRGIGVLWKEPGAWKTVPQQTRVPRSYVSWLLNEWAWRASGL